MKTNDYLLLTATGAYSFLFYQQNAGINFLLFTIIFLTVLFIRNKELVKQKKWLWAALLCVIAATSVFVHSSALSIIANIVCLILVSALSFNTNTSSLFAFIFSGLSMFTSVVFMVNDAMERWKKHDSHTTAKKGYKLAATGIVLVLSILFFMLYQASNPLFAENTKWINLDFISINWVLFTVFGFILLYGLFYQRTIKQVEVWENNISLYNKPFVETSDLKRYEAERYAGFLLFTLLNVMLIVLNVGDIQTLYFGGGLPKGISHSDFVHNGVEIIILSILIATGLIMFLFRYDFSGIKQHKGLTVLVYVWVLQNMLMLSSVVIRNNIYVHVFDLTYMRIGVYVWLLLAIMGLSIMFWKIYKLHSNWYLIKTNVAVWFSVLVLSTCFNWDKLITSYNINSKPLTSVDFHYLMNDLSDSNIPELIAITKRPDFKLIYSKPKTNPNGYNDDTYIPSTYTQLLAGKIEHYLANRRDDWRSFDLCEKQIMESIY